MIPKRTIYLIATLWLALAATATAQPAAAPAPAPATEPRDGAPVVVWNRTVHVFRSPYEQYSPAQRAAKAKERIEGLPELGPWEINVNEAMVGQYRGLMVTVNGAPMIGVLPADLDTESGETLQQTADKAATQLRAALEARARQRSLPLVLKAIGLAIGATALLLVLLWFVFRARAHLHTRVEETAGRSERLQVAGLDTRPLAVAIGRAAVRLLGWAVVTLLMYLWLVFVLRRLPYTEPWGDRLGAYLISISKGIGNGVINALPSLFTALVIFLLARVVTRIVGGFFQQVDDGRLAVNWIHPETAQATRRLVMVMIWAFAFILAYPYIPGSQTEAFKGVSVFVGLIITLGSGGLVSQMLSGLVVVYSRAFRTGDFVRIGETEGVVSEVGMLSAKVVTRRREEITIPNSVLVSSTSVNYTRLAGGEGAVLAATVTIGYDAPWRQVHALLLLAAERTAGIRKDPRPRVQQKALADFYVEYCLLFNLDRPEDRFAALSEVHAQIQDAFNEFGVQIMSPHFESQPPSQIFVPKNHWFAAPGDQAPLSGNSNEVKQSLEK
jgi:small-conductance mechanosensitive channel